MEATTDIVENESVWGGGNKPLNASYGKMMMWFFIVSDALTFSGFLVAYGFSRFKNIDSWPIADEVFYHFPFLHGIDAPMYYVALMTFILIFSSVTMVLAVDAGHKMQKTKVAVYMLLTIVGGAVFVGSQAWEWKNFIQGEYGAVETKGGQILQFVTAEYGERVTLESFASTLQTDRSQHTGDEGLWFVSESALHTYSVAEVQEGFLANPDLLIKTEMIDPETGHKIVLDRAASEAKIAQAMYVVEGANLVRNEYGNRLFADFFFFITGTYERRGHYEMVEKVGLYWHFVDLVWVFVFTFFYLV